MAEPAQHPAAGRPEARRPEPRRPEARRTADWYELFFDLVFVVVIAVSAELIEHDPRPLTVLLFLALFFPLWWAWVNLSVATNLFGPSFPSTAVLLVAAMPGPAAMAIAISGGIAQFGWLYALGAVWIRVALLAMWLVPWARGAIGAPLWRLLAYNLGTAVLWIGSLWLPEPYRYIAWGLAVAIEVALLAIRRGFSYDVYERASMSHFLERVGLFVVIVIGEAVYLAVTELARHPTVTGAAAALFGAFSCVMLARAYFRWGAPTTERGLDAAVARSSFGAVRDVVMYLPFVLVASLTLVAAAVGIAVAEGGHPLSLDARVLLLCGIGGFYLANALVGFRLGRPRARIALLLIPSLGLPAIACLATGALPAWATLAFAGFALLLLDVVSKLLHHVGGAVQPRSRTGTMTG